MDVPGAPRIRDAFFLPRAIISKAESKAISKEEGGCEWSIQGLKRAWNFSTIEYTFSPEANFQYGSQGSSRFVYL